MGMGVSCTLRHDRSRRTLTTLNFSEVVFGSSFYFMTLHARCPEYSVAAS